MRTFGGFKRNSEIVYGEVRGEEVHLLATPFWLGVEAEWDDPALDDAHVQWGRTTMSALQPFTAAGHYVNDMVEQSDDIVRSIYGDAKYDRLRALKRTHDPDNVFRLNQNIRP